MTMGFSFLLPFFLHFSVIRKMVCVKKVRIRFPILENVIHKEELDGSFFI